MSIDIEQMNKALTDTPLYAYNDNGDRIDMSSQPVMGAPELPELVTSDKIKRKGKAFGRYAYNGILVPRVTAILNYCDGDTDGLALYASRVGYRYAKEQKKTLDIGTHTHAAIAEFLTSGTVNCIRNISEGKDEVYQCIENFINWYNHVTKDLGWNIELYLSEAPIICPWCGGTLDAIVSINGRRYIVDFKSSKKLTTEYFIQVSTYLWIIENYYPEYMPIHGLGLIRIDKYNPVYEDVFLDLSDPNDYNFICQCQETFGLALKVFYSMNILDQEVIEETDRGKQAIMKSKMLDAEPSSNKHKRRKSK